MNNRFAAGLGKLKEVSGKAHSISAAHTTETAADRPISPKKFDQANRRGKVVISGYFDPAVRKQLAVLAIEQDATQAGLMAEALNLLFEKYGRSPIAKA